MSGLTPNDGSRKWTLVERLLVIMVTLAVVLGVGVVVWLYWNVQ